MFQVRTLIYRKVGELYTVLQLFAVFWSYEQTNNDGHSHTLKARHVFTYAQKTGSGSGRKHYASSISTPFTH